MKNVLFIAFVLLGLNLFGQANEQQFIQGVIVDAKTSQPVPFAKIYNTRLQEGTLTNFEGFFIVPVSSNSDSITIVSIGYQRQQLLYNLTSEYQTIRLEQSIQLIDEVTVSPKNVSYLYELLQNCRKSASRIETKGKAVYELKSYFDSTQIELVEGYYNYSAFGYDLADYNLKAGRLAVRPIDGRSFLSTESSRAVSILKTTKENQYFPVSPLELNKRKNRKTFFLSLENKYLDNNRDSIYIIDFKPRDTSGSFFSGRIWVNKTKKYLLKVNTKCSPCGQHPFVPLFPNDTLKEVRMNITKTFVPKGKSACFDHVDFNYEVDYKTRVQEGYYTQFTVKTLAVMYAYDNENTFELPQFEFPEMAQMDYRKTLALPHNSFFWEWHNEDKLSVKKSENDAFYALCKTFKLKPRAKNYVTWDSSKGIFEGAHIRWSKNRILFREEMKDVDLLKPQLKARMYNLSVKLFYDKNTYDDSTNVLTATIFDPFESYYYLPIDRQTNCFINMYFDICEIARIEMEETLIKNLNMSNTTYQNTIKKLEYRQSEFLRDVERGTNERGMKKWNDYIVQGLGIDNMAIFKPFPESIEQQNE